MCGVSGDETNTEDGHNLNQIWPCTILDSLKTSKKALFKWNRLPNFLAKIGPPDQFRGTNFGMTGYKCMCASSSTRMSYVIINIETVLPPCTRDEQLKLDRVLAVC